MSNRFTDTAKWSDSWFQNLEPAFKLAWLYIIDNCDNAGVLDLNRRLADFQIGMPIDWETFISDSDGRVVVLESGKVWARTFVVYQQRGAELNEANKAHQQVIRLLKANGIYEDYLSSQKEGGYKPLARGLEGACKPHMYSNGKVKVKSGNTKEEVTHSKSKKTFTPPTIEEVNEYAEANTLDVDGGHFCDFYTVKGWKVGKEPMKDWQAAARNAHRQGWCKRAGPNPGGYVPLTIKDIFGDRCDDAG